MIGVDEVGRGAFAGPLLVCAVRANKKIDLPGLTDSKLINPNKRQLLAKDIIANYDIGYGWIDAATIDKVGLTGALVIACNKAIAQINASYKEHIILDGTVNYLKEYNCKTIIKADLKVPVVSAASVVAKYTRDIYMIDLAKKYTNYGFENNKGYGTKEHIGRIKEFGLSKHHRRLFVKKMGLF